MRKKNIAFRTRISYCEREMSYFSSEMNRLMTAKKMLPSDVSRAAGISEPTISRWLNDKQHAVRPEALERLCQVLGTTKREQAGLIRARLLDQCYGQGADLIHIQIGREPVLFLDSSKRPLPGRLEAAFEVLRENFEDADLQQVILGLAGWFKKNLPEKPCGSKPYECY